MKSINPPIPDCDACVSGIVIRICRMCDLQGSREIRGEWRDCTFCAGDGVTRHVCDCCVYGVPCAWARGGIVAEVTP